MAEKTYTSADLVSILRQMIDYVEDTDKKQNSLYLQDLAYCGLFHDAIGEVEHIDKENDKIIVLIEY